jgi:hypothetical protein
MRWTKLISTNLELLVEEIGTTLMEFLKKDDAMENIKWM